MKKTLRILSSVILLISLLVGCSFSIESFSNNLNKAVRSSNDPQTISEALPAYLILLDGLIEEDPENEEALKTSSKLILAYISLLDTKLEVISDKSEVEINRIKEQKLKLAQKAFDRSSKAICIYDEEFCNLAIIGYKEYVKRIKFATEEDLDMLYSLGTAWATWIQMNSGDWNAVAQIPRVKIIMQAVISIDEHWQDAGGHLYLGVLNSLLPASIGGKPDIGKQHFETALQITDNKNQMIKVLYAKYYARLTFNKELHNKLLNEVLESRTTDKNLILVNTLAQEKAKALMISAREFF